MKFKDFMKKKEAMRADRIISKRWDDLITKIDQMPSPKSMNNICNILTSLFYKDHNISFRLSDTWDSDQYPDGRFIIYVNRLSSYKDDFKNNIIRELTKQIEIRNEIKSKRFSISLETLPNMQIKGYLESNVDVIAKNTSQEIRMLGASHMMVFYEVFFKDSKVKDQFKERVEFWKKNDTQFSLWMELNQFEDES